MNHKNIIKNTISIISIIVLGMLLLGAAGAAAQTDIAPEGTDAALGKGFTYQGYITDDAQNPITDTCDFRFQLHSAITGLGTQIGSDYEAIGIDVENGYFTTRVNINNEFGNNAFKGEERYLAVAVRCGSSSSYTSIGLRQRLSAVPYALYAMSVPKVDSTLYISPHNLVERGTSGCVSLTPQDNGSMKLTMSAGCTSYISAPVSTFGSLLGATLYIKSVEVCYKDNNENNYIDTTAVIKNNGGEGEAFYIIDSTDRGAETRSCYTLDAATPHLAIDNSSWVQFNMRNINPMGSGYDFFIYTIKLTLSQD